MSNNRSLITGSVLGGVNIAGKPGECCLEYTPAHIKPDGSPVSAMTKFRVYANKGPGANGQDRVEVFPLTAWGALADTAAKWFSPGLTITAIVMPASYDGVVRDPQGNPIVINGVTILKKTWGFETEQLLFHNGGESAGTIAFELSQRLRGPNWRDKQSVDGQQYGAFLKNKSAMVWDGAAKTFFYSVIKLPKQATMIFKSNADFEAYRKANGLRSTPAATANMPAVPVMAMPQQPVTAPNGFVIPPAQPVAGAAVAGTVAPVVYGAAAGVAPTFAGAPAI